MSDAFTIESAESPTSDDISLIRRGLGGYNRTAGGLANYQDLTLFVRDPAAQLVGGLLGYTLGTWLHIETLWLQERVRGAGLGSRLLKRAEEIAIARGCRVIDLTTFDFQAPNFYKKNGYVAFAELGEVGGDHTVHFFRKRLGQDAPRV